MWHLKADSIRAYLTRGALVSDVPASVNPLPARLAAPGGFQRVKARGTRPSTARTIASSVCGANGAGCP